MGLLRYLAVIIRDNGLALGNGPVLLPLLRRSLVDDGGALTVEQLLFAFALSQATPGQGNLYVSSLALMLYGPVAAILALVAVNAPAWLMLPIAKAHARFAHNKHVASCVRGLVAASAGLIFAATFDLARQALTGPIGWIELLTVLALTRLLDWCSLASLLVACSAGIVLLLCFN